MVDGMITKLYQVESLEWRIILIEEFYFIRRILPVLEPQ
jgi:hypothetical protein